MIFVIIILIGLFLWWKFKNSQPKNEFGLPIPKFSSKEYTNVTLHNSLAEAKDGKEFLTKFISFEMARVINEVKSTIPKQEQEFILGYTLLDLQNKFIENAPEISKETNLPLDEVRSIVLKSFKEVVQ